MRHVPWITPIFLYAILPASILIFFDTSGPYQFHYSFANSRGYPPLRVLDALPDSARRIYILVHNQLQANFGMLPASPALASWVPCPWKLKWPRG